MWSCSGESVGKYEPPAGNQPIPAFLGIDIGSVSTNVVAMDEWGRVIKDVYLRTAGRPVEAVQQGLAEIQQEWGTRLVIQGVGTTGSGRELIAELVGADVVKRRDHGPQDRRPAHQRGTGPQACGHDLRDRRAGLQVHLDRERRGGGLRHERSLRRRHGLISRGTGREARDQHQGRIRPAGPFLGGAHAVGRALHGLHGARRHRLAAPRPNPCPTWWPDWRIRSP